MPRKKTKIKERHTRTQSVNVAPLALKKVEKEFFTIPVKLVKNAGKEIEFLKKKTSKLVKTVHQAGQQAAKIEKQFTAMQRSKKAVKRSIITALKKQHRDTVKWQATLSKEQTQARSALNTIEAFHAKFSGLSKTLNQFEKEWEKTQKTKLSTKKVKKQAPKNKSIQPFAKNDTDPYSTVSHENEIRREKEEVPPELEEVDA